MIDVAVWLPTAVTEDAYSISDTYAWLDGYGDGGEYLLDNWGFDYGLSTDYDQGFIFPIEPPQLHQGFTVMLSELTPDTTYHFRAKVRDTAGNWAYGEDKTFHTEAIAQAFLHGKVMDPAGDPVQWAALTLNGMTTTSGADGSYSFLLYGVVPPGPYTLACEKEGYESHSEDITLYSGENIRDIVLGGVAPAKATIHGLVHDTAGDTIPAVNVILNGVTTATMLDGTFAITNLEPGPYTITCTKDGWQDFIKDITLEEGDNPIDIEMLAVGEEPPSWWDKHWKKVAIIGGASAAAAGGIALAVRK